jgi:ferredoxin-NADP reductase
MALQRLFTTVALFYDGKKKIAPSTFSFNFTFKDSISWKAGQYGIFEIRLPGEKRLIRPFSISSAPAERVVTITTKIRLDNSDAFKKALLKLKRGDQVKMRGPIGRLNINNHSKSYVFLTTGVGITPFRAILKQLVMDGELNTDITLFYVGNKESHLFKDELTDLKATLRNFKIIYIYKPDRITGQLIEDSLGNKLFLATYFLSGSPKLVKSYWRTLVGLGIPDKQIKSTQFTRLRLKFKSKKPSNVPLDH